MKTISFLIAALFCCPLMADEAALLEILAAIADTPATSDGSTPATPLIAAPDVAPAVVTRQVWSQTGTRRVKRCVNGFCSYRDEPVYGYVSERVAVETTAASDYATPPEVGNRILSYLRPQPGEVFLDVGSGDGRVCIEAARRFGCRAIGIEIDPERVALARAAADRRGVAHLVTFIEGDFTKIEWPTADVGYAYLFPDDLKLVRARLTRLKRFACFAHEVPGLSMSSHGDFYSWSKPEAVRTVPAVMYGGRAYTRPVCNRANCAMCNAIRRGLAAQ